MSEIESFDGRYLCADQGDGNFVVYRKSDMFPLWDRWSYEDRNNIPRNMPNGDSSHPDTPVEPFPHDSSSEPVLIARGVNPIGMSYWRNINCHRGRGSLLVVLSINDELTLLTINKRSLEVVDERQIGIHHTGEGIYFSATRHDILYVTIDGVLYAINVFDGSKRLIWESLDHNLWQVHSSLGETIHSATIRNHNYENICWGVLINGQEKLYSFKGKSDECQIDKTGRYLICKEDNDNRIINIHNDNEIVIFDPDGAVGHSDVGFELVVGEDNFVGGLVLWDLNTMHKTILFGPNVWNMGYVSLQNNLCLLSLPDGSLKLVQLNGAVRDVCHARTDSQDYEYRIKANLCPLAEYAAYTALVDGSVNAYIVRV